MKRISNKQLWLVLVAVAVIWFSNLEYRKLIKPDEGRYAEIPREMLVSGDWTTPRLNGLKYFEKPPLQYWATASAYAVFGEHHWTSRLWTALTGFAGILLVWFSGLRLYGRDAANYSALALVGAMFYTLMAHFNTLDMGVTFFISLGIFGFLLAQTEVNIKNQRNWMLLAWAALALAVLSKGLMGLVLPGAALFIYMVVQRDISILKRMHWLPGISLFMLVTVPWFYLVMKANPEFFQFFFIHEHLERFTTKVHDRFEPWYYFIPILLAGMLPWTLVMFDALLKSWKQDKKESRTINPERFLLIWVVFVFIFFSISDSKLASYILPMFPALALLMGKQLANMNARRLFWLIAPLFPLMVIGLGFSPFTARLAEDPVEFQEYSEYAYWIVPAVVIWTLGMLTTMVLLWRSTTVRDNKLWSVLILSTSTLIASQLVTSGYNTVAVEKSGYIIAEAIRPYVKPDKPFYSVHEYEQTLPFYLKHTFTLVDYENEMAFGIMQEPQLAIPTLEEFSKVWAGQSEALAIMPVRMFEKLKQLGCAMKIIYQDTQFIVVEKP